MLTDTQPTHELLAFREAYARHLGLSLAEYLARCAAAVAAPEEFELARVSAEVGR